MKNLIIILVILICIQKQLIAQQNTFDTIVRDLNNDKVMDTLINYYESGSSCGGRTISIINGKSQEKNSLNNYGCYNTFTKKIRIPESLTLRANRLFLDVFEENLLPQKRAHMDSSLKWLISAELNLKQLDAHPFFNIIASPKTNWQSSILAVPEAYYLNISGDTLQRLIGKTKENFRTKNEQGYLVYYTVGYHIKTLENLTPIAQNEDYQIYKTDHAVFVKKGSTYRWVFISDENVTGAPGRHSWVSINQIQLIDNYLIIHQDVPPDSLYNIQIVNIETQKIGRLNFSPSYNNWTDKGGMHTFRVIDDVLVFTEYGEPELKKIQLKELFKTLNKS